MCEMIDRQDLPRVTFGIIVLNGEPFVRYNLRALYPFAHQIIVVEGAVSTAAKIATADGHSTDSTLETLYRFKAEEDPENKVQIVVKDGFWDEKDEMSQAYAQRATGDYLWQVDVDEFYHPKDMQIVLDMLRANPDIAAVFFKQISFWGGFDYFSDGWYLRQAQGQGPGIILRLFKWGSGYRYVSHRPVTIHDAQEQNLCHLNMQTGREMARRGILMYHYSLVFPRQVNEKCKYYSAAVWSHRSRAAQRWANESFFQLGRPYRVHNVYRYPSWLERFVGPHPPQIDALRKDIEVGHINITLRPTDDIERLLQSRRYQMGRVGLKMVDPVARLLLLAWRRGRRWLDPSKGPI
ncbi:MAG: glycosyltransferase family 2 protein [Chloroflexi bacterium]|nr:glycosyltransferase family 2 protein [Chloroflexota bacterium]